MKEFINKKSRNKLNNFILNLKCFQVVAVNIIIVKPSVKTVSPVKMTGNIANYLLLRYVEPFIIV